MLKAVASDREASDRFGYAVAMDGNYAIIGAYWEDHDAAGGNMVLNAGSVYILVRNGGVWTQQQKIVPNDRGDLDWFGNSVDIDGDYAIIGAPYNDLDASGGGFLLAAGAAYIFVRNGTTWTQQQKIVASDREQDNIFGYSVAIDGSHALVGAYQEDEDAAGLNTKQFAGAAYSFSRNGSTWTQQQKIVASDRVVGARFGYDVDLDGVYAIIGSGYKDHYVGGGIVGPGVGAAYIFIRNGSTWSEQQKLMAGDWAENDHFGESVAIDGDRAIAGAPFEDEDAVGANTVSSAGSAYLFVRSGTTWSQEQKIVASDRAASDVFGASVAIDALTAVVGAYQEDEDAAGLNTAASAGSVYVFGPGGTPWAQQQKIVASDRAANDYFGWSLAVSGDQLVAGAYREDEDAMGGSTLSESGSAYLFTGPPQVVLDLKVWLEGPLITTPPILMNDHLRIAGYLPFNEPYTALGFMNAGDGGGETTTAGVLATSGNNAALDWVRVELRNSADPTAIVATRHCLVQRDGDVVSAFDGSSPVILGASPGSYYVAIRHRNHLGCMTAGTVALNTTTTTIDFRSQFQSAYGANARKMIGSTMALWAGNTAHDTPPPFLLKYAGAGNDRDKILVAIGGTIPTNTITGYRIEDVNLDGVVKYSGPSNDRDPILVNIGGTIPTSTRTEQLP